MASHSSRNRPGTTQLERFVGPRKPGISASRLELFGGNAGSSIGTTTPWTGRAGRAGHVDRGVFWPWGVPENRPETSWKWRFLFRQKSSVRWYFLPKMRWKDWNERDKLKKNLKDLLPKGCLWKLVGTVADWRRGSGLFLAGL